MNSRMTAQRSIMSDLVGTVDASMTCIHNLCRMYYQQSGAGTQATAHRPGVPGSVLWRSWLKAMDGWMDERGSEGARDRLRYDRWAVGRWTVLSDAAVDSEQPVELLGLLDE